MMILAKGGVIQSYSESWRKLSEKQARLLRSNDFVEDTYLQNKMPSGMLGILSSSR